MESNQVNPPAAAVTLIKVNEAAARMGCSPATVYREITAGNIGPLVKVTSRASALPAASVDAWIQARIDAATKG